LKGVEGISGVFLLRCSYGVCLKGLRKTIIYLSKALIFPTVQDTVRRIEVLTKLARIDGHAEHCVHKHRHLYLLILFTNFEPYKCAPLVV